MENEYIRLSHLAMLTSIKRQTLSARAKVMFDKKDIMRTPGNHIVLTTEQAKALIKDDLCFEKGKIIYIGNRKGGVGKTTIAYLLIKLLSSMGLRVCGIDIDQQADLSQQFIKISVNQPVFFDIITDTKHEEIGKKLKISDIIVSLSPTLDFIPSSIKNCLIPQVLSMQNAKHLEKWLNNLCLDRLRESYDVIIIDIPADPNTLLSAFHVCLKENDHIVIPVSPDEFSCRAIGYVLKDFFSIRDEYEKISNPKISVLVNRFSQNKTIHMKDLLAIKDQYDEFLCSGLIKETAQISQIVSEKIPLNEIKDAKEFYENVGFLLHDFGILSSEK